MVFFQQDFWSGVPFLPPGDLPDPGIEPAPLTSPALAGGFLPRSTTWEVVKNLLANEGDLRDAGSIPGSGRSP